MHPQESVQVSKVGETDDTIALGSRRMPWVNAVTKVIMSGPPGEKPVGVDYPTLLKHVSDAGLKVGV